MLLLLLLLKLPLRRKGLDNVRDTFRLKYDLGTITSSFRCELGTEVVDINILRKKKKKKFSVSKLSTAYGRDD